MKGDSNMNQTVLQPFKEYAIQCLFFGVVLCSMFCSPCFAALESITSIQDVHIREGLKLVETFYAYMLSDAELKDCPDIFSDMTGTTSVSRRKKEVFLVWKFIRENTPLFLGLTEYGPPEKFFPSAGKAYQVLLSKSPEGLSIISGMEIVLFTPLGSRSGIRKQISFPLLFNSEKNKYTIDALGIGVNGIAVEISTLLDLDGFRKYERDFDWFERLGFKKQ